MRRSRKGSAEVPNTLAYMVLMLWPAIGLALFARLPFTRAFVWSILGAYLFLPPSTGFNFPMVPTLDKNTIPALTTFVICAVLMNRRVLVMPSGLVGRLLLILFMLAPALTVVGNGEPLQIGRQIVPGMRLYDVASVVAAQALIVLPFLMARRFLATEDAQRQLLRAYMVAGLAYSVLMLFEVRMSPQLNTWIYGFFQHDFGQMMRQGGFRPIVFLQHGIWVAFFGMTTIVSTLALWRVAPTGAKARYALIAGYLTLVLVLCKTLGPLVYLVMLAPVVCLLGPKRQIQIAACLATFALAYPVLRTVDAVPVAALLGTAERIDPQRSASLGFRFDHEGVILRHANEKPFFGWGTWGRGLPVHPGTGRTAVPDGKWVITVSSFGRVGYVAEFGLLTLPIFLLLLGMRGKASRDISPYAGPMALLLAINMIDMLPNATLTPLTWLLSGALLGYAERLRSASRHGVRAGGGPPVRAVLSDRAG